MTLPTVPVVPQPTSSTFAVDALAFTQFMADLATALPEEIDRINALGAGSYNATSTTSLTIGTGSKSLTVEADKGYAVGQAVLIASTAGPTNYMVGQVTSYNSGTGALVVNVTSTGGGGTVAAWAVSVTALAAGGGVSPDSIVLLTSGTSWTCPAGVTKARLRLVGGGGGGANYGSSGIRSGGGGGGGLVDVFVVLTPATSYTYAIGSGAAVGGSGGDTTMTVAGVTYSASGGSPGGAWVGGNGGGGSGTGALVLAGQKGFGNQVVSGNANVSGGFSAAGAVYGKGGDGGQVSDAEAGSNGAIILELYK